MFCSNCGTQLPDGTKFCNNCGAQQAAASNPAPAQPVSEPLPPVQPVQPVQPAPEKPKAEKKAKKAPAKTSTRIIIAVAALLVGGLIGKFAIAPSLTADLTTNANNNNSLSDSVQQNTTANPAYEAILSDAYIVHFPAVFGRNMASFVAKQAEGKIFCSDFAYENDIVTQWVETLYVPVSGYTDSQKLELENTYRSQLASFDALGCCSVTFSMGNNYLTVKCTYSNLDMESNYSELYYAGYNSANAPISMSATERALLNDGSVKK